MRNVKVIVSILLFLVFIAYSNSFFTPYHYDDSTNILRNKNVHMKEFTKENVVKSFFAGGSRGDIYHPILYRPVAMFTIAMNYYLAGGLHPFGFHVVNFIVHITSAIFLFLFILSILKLPKFNGKWNNNAHIVAFLGTAFWALNPIQLTAVTYITQRMTSMSGMFYIAAMYFYLKARTGEKLKHVIISFSCIMLGVLSKENAIMVIFAIAMFDVIFIEQQNLKRNICIFLWLIFAGVLMVYAVQGVETFSYQTLNLGYAKRDWTLSQRLMTQPRVIVFYFMLLFFPSHKLMSLTHTVPVSTGFFSPPETIFAMIIIACLIAIAIVQARKYPIFSFAVLFFFLNHLIEGSIIPLELIYEHRNYIPSMFLFLPAAMILVKYYKRFKIPVFAVSSIIIAFLTFNTYQQNEVWKTDLDLWKDTIKKSPDPRSMFNLGGAYYTLFKNGTGTREDFKNAVKYFQLSRDFNQMFGTNYEQNFHKIPYGRVMFMAAHNVKMLTMIKDGHVRRGIAVDKEMMKSTVIVRKNG